MRCLEEEECGPLLTISNYPSMFRAFKATAAVLFSTGAAMAVAVSTAGGSSSSVFNLVPVQQPQQQPSSSPSLRVRSLGHPISNPAFDRPASSGNPDPDKFSLQYVALIHRHGLRTPMRGAFMPIVEQRGSWSAGSNSRLEIVHSNGEGTTLFEKRYVHGSQLLAGDAATGQLLPYGKEQMRQVGRSMRNLYIDHYHLLPDVLRDQSILYVRSTDYERAQQSVQNLLHALYPEKNRDLPVVDPPSYQGPPEQGLPFIVNTMEWQAETMFGQPQRCPRLRECTLEARASPEVVRHKEQAAALQQTVQDLLHGQSGGSSAPDSARPEEREISFNDVHTTWSIMLLEGVELPYGVTPEIASKVAEEARWEEDTSFSSVERCRLSVGLFFHDLIDQMQSSLANRSPVKCSIYSGHDSVIIPIVRGLGAHLPSFPPVASHITFEVFKFKKSKENYIRVLWTCDQHGRRDLKIPGLEVPEQIRSELPADVFLYRMPDFMKLANRLALSQQEYATQCIPKNPSSRKRGPTEWIE